jgi:dipeptidyl aminopeptidase/acylaminoacyl peptidase
MQVDIRETVMYRDTEALFRALRQPSTGQISDAAEVDVAPDGERAVFSGTVVEALEGALTTRICQVDLLSKKTRILTFGPNTDRLPKYSPDGRQIAFLSDRQKCGEYQLYLLDPVTGATRGVPAVQGWVEYLHWSPDGTRVLLGVAGHGADVSSSQGAVSSQRLATGVPSWMPGIQTGDETYRWRCVWVYELATNSVLEVSTVTTNIWEAVWCGNCALAAIVSSGPAEGMWYSAHLAIVEIDTGGTGHIFTPRDQIGCLSACPSGRYLACVEAICSDRWIVAGDLHLIETRSGTVQRIDTRGVDICNTEWLSDRLLLLAGHRGFDSVVGLYDMDSGGFTESWIGTDMSTGGRYITVSGLNESGDFVLVGESFARAPEISVICRGEYRPIKSFDLDRGGQSKVIRAVERVNWRAPDGLEIQGWLILPAGQGPFPVIVEIHGGPVWHWRPRWLGRSGLHTLMLVKRGYAVFLPNSRGSSGRGREFVRRILGDMGGADTYDYLSGLDHLVERGIADPRRLGVTGGSYGGFMSCWLIAQDTRFAAAVPVASITNHVTEHLLSCLPHFTTLFLEDTYTNCNGKYFERSPIMHAHKVKTPTLSVCGALDRCTPPEESAQFHTALLENGTRSVLVTYPEEGHGIRKLPANIDFAARLVAWFEEHMPTL